MGISGKRKKEERKKKIEKQPYYIRTLRHMPGKENRLRLRDYEFGRKEGRGRSVVKIAKQKKGMLRFCVGEGGYPE